MRTFILLALKARTSPDFALDKLKEAGRMDLVCRTISNALWIPNDLRRDTFIHIALSGPPNPPKLMTYRGDSLKGLEADEHTIAMSIKHALKEGAKLSLGEDKEVQEGVTIAKKAFETIVREKKHAQLVYLHP